MDKIKLIIALGLMVAAGYYMESKINNQSADFSALAANF